ncbi:MAG: hypothetical protein DMF68_21075 [Acidobacteria bacterium]|nr:MAG: hypothetical protein DMF68_21075 [Acidobacteriota bacterium]
MLNEKQVEEIVHALNQLPAEKVEQARDFIHFLQTQYGQRTVDESDVWSDDLPSSQPRRQERLARLTTCFRTGRLPVCAAHQLFVRTLRRFRRQV